MTPSRSSFRRARERTSPSQRHKLGKNEGKSLGADASPTLQLSEDADSGWGGDKLTGEKQLSPARFLVPEHCPQARVAGVAVTG